MSLVTCRYLLNVKDEELAALLGKVAVFSAPPTVIDRSDLGLIGPCSIDSWFCGPDLDKDFDGEWFNGGIWFYKASIDRKWVNARIKEIRQKTPTIPRKIAKVQAEDEAPWKETLKTFHYVISISRGTLDVHAPESVNARIAKFICQLLDCGYETNVSKMPADLIVLAEKKHNSIEFVDTLTLTKNEEEIRFKAERPYEMSEVKGALQDGWSVAYGDVCLSDKDGETIIVDTRWIPFKFRFSTNTPDVLDEAYDLLESLTS